MRFEKELQVCLYSVRVCPACGSNNSAINPRTVLLARQLSNRIVFPDASMPKRISYIFNLHKSDNDALNYGRADYLLLYVYKELLSAGVA
jgi:hypothetical protein